MKPAKIYEDSMCEQHKKQIIKICNKCKLNLCEKCYHNCNEIFNLKDFLLSEEEIKMYKKIFIFIFIFIHNTFRKAEKDYINKQKEFTKTYKINKDLYNLAKIVFCTYLEKRAKNEFSYKIFKTVKIV